MSTLSLSEVLVFHRADCFYTIPAVNEVPLARQAADHAAINPGTVRVEDRAGNVLWQAERANEGASVTEALPTSPSHTPGPWGGV